MKHALVLAGILLALCPAARAQGVPRVKAAIVSFDGTSLVLDTSAAGVKAASLAGVETPAARPQHAVSAKGAAAPPAAAPPPPPPQGKDGKLTVTLLPATLMVSERNVVRQALKIGDFIGAEVTAGTGGALAATSVYIYPDTLRGANEGRFADGNVTRIGGTLSAIGADTLTVHYRGLGESGGVCAGRAVSAAVTPRSCSGDATFAFDRDAPVTLMTLGTKSLLTPGALATVSLVRVAGGGMATPGIIVEKPQSAP